MGIRSMPWPEWIEVSLYEPGLTVQFQTQSQVDNQLPKYHVIRTDRIAKRGEKAVCTLPEKNGVPGGSLAGTDCVV